MRVDIEGLGFWVSRFKVLGLEGFKVFRDFMAPVGGAWRFEEGLGIRNPLNSYART